MQFLIKHKMDFNSLLFEGNTLKKKCIVFSFNIYIFIGVPYLSHEQELLSIQKKKIN